jgi:peptide/nickel transport system permease protein
VVGQIGIEDVTAYLIRRLLAVIPVMFVVVTVIFLLIHLIPGDPVAIMLGPDAAPQQIAQVRATYGLDLPLHWQLLKWYNRVLRGDLGESYFLGRTVLQAMLERLEPTMVLTILALLVAVIIGIPAGVIAAAHPNSLWDRLLMAFALLGVCIPSFWLALNLIYLFAVQLKWLPAMGYAPLSQGLGKNLRYMLLPAVALGFNQSALIARIARSCMLEVMRQDYIRTARAKGLAERVVIYIHALRNALIPTITVIGITFAILIGGAVVTEVVFNIPGLGRLIISAILRRDYPVVQGCVLFLTMTYVLINLGVDIIYVFVDPRIRYD